MKPGAMTSASIRAPILAPPASDRVITELNGLRGIAILLVIVHHFWPQTGALARYARLADMGWIGVDLFFVISGTLITGILIDSKDGPRFYKNFYARRALRIFPLYYVFLIGVFAWPLLREGLHGAFVGRSGSPLWYLFYLGNVPEGLFAKDPPPFVAPLWSLAIEEQFYITFPLVVAALDRKKLTRLLVALVVLAPIVRAVTAAAFPELDRVQYLVTPCRADVIAMGGLIAVAVRDPRFAPSKRALDLAVAAALAAMPAAYAMGLLDRTQPFGRTLGYTIVALVFATLVVYALANRATARTRALTFAPLCYFGQLCYGLYLLHRPAEYVLERALDRASIEVPGALAFVLKIIASLGVATISWHAFEKRILRLKARFGRSAEVTEATTETVPSMPRAAATATR